MKIHKSKVVPRNDAENKYEDEILRKNIEKISGYDDVLDTSLAIAIIDLHGMIMYANDHYCRISRHNLEELIGQEYCIINPAFHAEDFIDELKKAISQSRIWTGPLKNLAKDGTIYWLDTTLVPDLNEQGVVFQYLAIGADITSRKYMQELLIAENNSSAANHKDRDKVRLIHLIKDQLFQHNSEDHYSDNLKLANKNLFFLKNEKAKIAADLVLAKKVIVLQNQDKEKRAIELLLANKELLFQNEEKVKRANEPLVANQELAHHIQEKKIRATRLLAANTELVIQNTDKGKLASELSEALDLLILLASIADNIQDPVFSLDENLNITRWNAAAERLLEWKSDEVIGKKLELILKVAYPDAGIQQIFECLNNQNSWQGEAIYYTKSGNPKNMLITASYLKDVGSRIIGSLFLLRDITPQIKSEKLYRGLFEHMMHGFAFCKSIMKDGEMVDYTYQVVNREYEKLIGNKKVTGKKASEVFPGIFENDPVLSRQLNAIVFDEGSVKFEHYFKQINKWVSLSLYSLEEGSFVILMDSIEERKLAEQKMKNLNNELEEKVIKRTEELEAFSYSVSHDLRAPLRAIDGYAQMLREDYSHLLDKEGKRFIETIQLNANNMGTLIDDLLAFSRLGRKEVNKSFIDMTDLVEAVKDEITKSYPNKAEIKINSLHPVTADYTLMNQVIMNLLSNAIKYSLLAKDPVIEISSQQKGAELVYSVKDNGAGFDMQYVHKLYGVFQRLHSAEEFEGTGVGLAIVKRIIEKQGGKVWAEGKEGQGAVFYFSLPGS
ncbi:MAG: PAS domain-containing protein [Saprospiraceae bacterium]|nr:PAS domain-containing protein [Saprospiraceae bacterium]